MYAYLPTRLFIVFAVALIVLGASLIGFAITRMRSLGVARVAAWLMVLGWLATVDRMCTSEPAGVRMLALISVGLVAMKAPVAVATIAAGVKPLPLGRWLCFSLAWFGMQPRAFAERKPRDGVNELVSRGINRLLLGALLFLSARYLWSELGSRVTATILALVGISLMLHFGIMNLVTAAWRRVGFDCQPLFRAPLAAESLGEFWGRRWNLAFSEMAAIALYRPLATHVGRASATMIAFVFSGLLHEMAISLPVRAGYGLPLSYFVLHGALTLAERQYIRRGHAVAGWRGRTWMLAWLALPLPILFHTRFLAGVVWPLLGSARPSL